MILASGYGDIGESEKALTSAAELELNKLLQQINDLLLIEKIDAGLYQMTAEKFEVFPLLAATAESFGETASRKKVRLVPASTPECQELCINGDKSLVEREFAIIISNAVEAAPSGSTIDVAVERSGNVISVSFKDRGNGIDEELLPQIFERFRFVGGKPVTGLGLPLAQRLSAIHGGSLEINSSPSGTETRVTLPIAV
jgi:signal transduction histidine kinase